MFKKLSFLPILFLAVILSGCITPSTTSPASSTVSASLITSDSSTTSPIISPSTSTTTTAPPDITIISAFGPLQPADPAGPTIEITLKNTGNVRFITLYAVLKLNKDFNIKFDVGYNHFFSPGNVISVTTTLPGGEFDYKTAYTFELYNGRNTDPTYTQQLKFEPLPVVPAAKDITGYDESKPAPVNYTVNMDTDMSVTASEQYPNDFSIYHLEMAVTEVDRGAKAYDLIKAANPAAAAAPDGFEYVAARVHADFTALVPSANKPTNYVVFVPRYCFEAYSASGAKYPAADVNTPSPEIKLGLPDGESGDGWIVFEIPSTDGNPVIEYSYVQIRLWFNLAK